MAASDLVYLPDSCGMAGGRWTEAFNAAAFNTTKYAKMGDRVLVFDAAVLVTLLWPLCCAVDAAAAALFIVARLPLSSES